MSLVNRYNFLRWDDQQPAATIISDLPRGYLKDANRCDYRPVLLESETMRFYINAPAGLSFIGDPDNGVLNLVNAVTGATTVANIAPLQIHTFAVTGGTAKTYYADVIADGTVPAGIYYLQIMQVEDVKLISNQIEVKKLTSDYRSNTTLCKFRHDRYFYGVNYQDLSTFYQQFRLHINEIETPQFDGEKEVYNEVTTGTQRTYNNFMKEIVKAETYYFDKLAHEAAAVMFDHDEIFLNLKQYVAKGTYKPPGETLSKLSKGEIELYVQEFATANRCTG